MKTIWLGPDYLTKTSVVDSNVEYGKIKPFIVMSQRMDILRKLGTNLYNAIDTQVLALINSATPIPTNYSKLFYDYILDALLCHALLRSIPSAKYRYTNKGILVKRSDNADAAEDDALESLMNGWKSYGEMIEEEMINYIRFNPTFFPEYYTNINEQIRPEQTAYDTDMFLGDEPPIYRDKQYRMGEFWDQKY